MRKIATILLVFIIAFNQVGCYFVFKYMQHRVREEMMQDIVTHLNLDDTEAVCLTGNEKDIEWEEEGREFLYHGQMYDVVRTVFTNGKVIIYCINDEKESRLIANYLAAAKQNSTQNKKAKNTRVLTSLFVLAKSEPLFCESTSCKSLFPVIEFFLSPGTVRILIPPPKAAA